MKTKPAIVAILALLAALIVGLGVHGICMEKQRADLYAASETALAAHQWHEALRQGSRQALAQFETLSGPDYKSGRSRDDVSERLIEAHYLAGIAYLEAEQFDQAVAEFSQVALDYKDAADKLAQAFDGSMVHVPAGEFIMGNDTGNPDERPQRRVYLDAFDMDKYEVTNAQYRRFIQATGREAPQTWPGRYVQFTDSKISLDWQAGTYPAGQATYPVVMVNWADADAYCAWVGKRLPTEAEWEKAARGTDGRIYPWGNTWDAGKANTRETGIGHPQPVGSYPAGASPYGALDMVGNVWEWVADQYGRDYYSQALRQSSGQAPDRNPQGPSVGWGNVQRGGSWYSLRQHVSTTFRNMTHCYAPNYRVGFRCARGAD
jgi:formylglycine-generating enzyme required for sulfatase activity